MQDLTAGDDTESKPEAAAYKVYVTADKAIGRSTVRSQDEDRRPTDAATEIYKIYVTTVESNIERRMKLNQYYYSVVAAIVVAYAYLVEGRLKPPADLAHLIGDSATGNTSTPMLLLLPASLLIICFAWWSQLKSAEFVSRTKFETIYEIEGKLAIRPFTAEQSHRNGPPNTDATTNDKWSTKAPRWSGSQIETVVPMLFAAMSIIAVTTYFGLPSFKW